MLILVGAFLVSLIPSVLVFLWLKKQKKEDEAYGKACNKAMKYGLISPAAVFLGSLTLYLLGLLLKVKTWDPIRREAYHTFVIVVLPEELVKMFILIKYLKDVDYKYSWRDIVAFMIIINLGFAMVEDLVYAFTTSPGQMLVRGLFIMHGGYGFVMGCFFAKGKAEKNGLYYVLAVLVPWILHGLYDFTLDDTIAEINDVLFMTPFIMLAVDVVLLVRAFLFFKKTKDKEKYTTPLEN